MQLPAGIYNYDGMKYCQLTGGVNGSSIAPPYLLPISLHPKPTEEKMVTSKKAVHEYAQTCIVMHLSA
jgi:hypothetical protein